MAAPTVTKLEEEQSTPMVTMPEAQQSAGGAQYMRAERQPVEAVEQQPQGNQGGQQVESTTTVEPDRVTTEQQENATTYTDLANGINSPADVVGDPSDLDTMYANIAAGREMQQRLQEEYDAMPEQAEESRGWREQADAWIAEEERQRGMDDKSLRKRERVDRARKAAALLGDIIATIGNLYAANAGAPAMKLNSGAALLGKALEERRDREAKLRASWESRRASAANEDERETRWRQTQLERRRNNARRAIADLDRNLGYAEQRYRTAVAQREKAEEQRQKQDRDRLVKRYNELTTTLRAANGNPRQEDYTEHERLWNVLHQLDPNAYGGTYSKPQRNSRTTVHHTGNGGRSSKGGGGGKKEQGTGGRLTPAKK